MMQQGFIYHWFVDDEAGVEGEKELMIRAYAITPQQETVVLHIRNFQPWLYLEIKKDGKTSEDWVDAKTFIKSKIVERCKLLAKTTFYLAEKKKLYFDDHRRYSFFKLRFKTISDRRNATYSLQNYKCRSMGRVYNIACHEQDATPLLQLVVSRNIPTAGWIQFKGRPLSEEARITDRCKEYFVDYEELWAVQGQEEVDLGVPVPTVLSFDIEVYSSNPQRMPMSDILEDCIFQISGVVEGANKLYKKYLLTLGKTLPSVIGSDVVIVHCLDEKELLLAFTALVREVNPHVIVGYNIFGFDLPYMIQRCKLHDILAEFDLLGIPHSKRAPEKTIKWSSTAYSYQEFHYLDAEGRVLVDLLPVVKRDYKFANYKLKTVSTFFLGETKDPLTHHDIFHAYEAGVLHSKKEAESGMRKLSRCGKYCVQDSALVLKLFGTLQLWIGLSEMAKICQVPMMYLFTKGQQIKVYSQVYKKCYGEDILVESIQEHPVLKRCQGYSGAFVFPPEPGIYDWVIPFDFSSLYPTTIIAYNIDYSTLVLDESLVDLKDCHVIEWEDHVNCEHDTSGSKKPGKAKTLCGKNRYVFRKSPMGVVPSLLMDLLNQRSDTKKQMKKIKAASSSMSPTEAETRLTVLDKRQLAYKLSANSAYGSMGVDKGYLPFMPGAMSTTAMGRASIQKAAEFVRSTYKGDLIYGDSVSGDTPLTTRSTASGTVRVMTADDIFTSIGKELPVQPYEQFRSGEEGMEDKQRIDVEDMEVFSKSGWTPVRRLIRHKTKKRMLRIYCTTGVLTVTEDHSLLDSAGNMKKPTEVSVGDTLMACHMSVFWKKKKSTRLMFPVEVIECMEILSDGRVVLYRTAEKNPCDIMVFYLYMSQKFPLTSMEFLEDRTVFHVNMKAEEDVSPSACTGSTLITKIEEVSFNQEQYVYDLETADGSFHAGVGNVIVKNTDSIYCHFPGYTNAVTAWKMAKKVEDQLLKLFPSPMKLVFEEKIYKTFLILTKKRYMAYTCGEDGTLDEKLTIRGVLLARRDNCKWIRVLYEQVVRSLMDRLSMRAVHDVVLQHVMELMLWKTSTLSWFVITKQVNKDYKIKAMPTDYKKFKKRMDDLGIRDHPVETIATTAYLEDKNKILEQDPENLAKYPWLASYVYRSKPGHVQLAMKMTERGKPVEAGSRIEFLIIQNVEDPKAKMSEKIEDPVYFTSHRDLLRMDRLYYLKALAEPLDQLLNVVFKKHKDYVAGLYKIHLQQFKLMKEIRARSEPIILLDDEVYKAPRKKAKKKTMSTAIAVVTANTATTTSTTTTGKTTTTASKKKALTLYDFL
jgi:DNA polymerase elongation subunit (family B)